ncbi:MAG TPA: cyclase family protein [Pseudomonadales bacterium]|nr:cyclase family protein [Pseudomonadales bacterium]
MFGIRRGHCRHTTARPAAPVLLMAVLAMAATLAVPGVADAEQLLPASPWGPDDTLGAANHLSPERVVEAARLVRTGKTYPLGVVTGRGSPAYPPRQYALTVLQLDDGTGVELGANRATGNDDLLYTWMGIGSQIDGLGHLGTRHTYYNNTPAADFVAPTGLTKLSTADIPPIVARGVLLDFTAHFGSDPVPVGTAIGRTEIMAAAKAQGVTLAEGDVVLLHTGWQALAETDPERFMAGEPGLGMDGARYLAEIGVVAVGADSWAVEVLPSEDATQAFPVHVELLARNGIYILESMNTAALAADQGWTFLFVLGQPRFEGAVQAIINPVAIR